MRLRCLVRLISLVGTLHGRLRRLLLRLGRRGRTSIGDLRVLRGVDAAGTVERHALHLVGEVWSLLLLLLLEMGRWGLGVRLVATRLPLLRRRHACHGVSVVDGRFVAAAGEFLRVARVQRVDAVGAYLALEAAWVADGGRWCAGSGVGV